MDHEEAFLQYFADNNYEYDRIENGFKLEFSNEPCPITQLVFFNYVDAAQQTRIQSITFPKAQISTEHYWEVLDLINRVNANRSYVSWSLDPMNGVIRSVAMAMVDPGSFSPAMAKAMVVMTSHDVDDVMTAVGTVIDQGLSGAEAYVLLFS